MAVFSFTITVKTSRKGKGAFPTAEAIGQLRKTMLDTYGEDGEDLMGYDGPTVTIESSRVVQHD